MRYTPPLQLFLTVSAFGLALSAKGEQRETQRCAHDRAGDDTLSGRHGGATCVLLICLIVLAGCNPVETDYISCKQEAEKALAASAKRPEVVHNESLELATACMRRRGYHRDD